MSDGMHALRELERPYAGLVEQERTLVRIRRGGVHPWPHVEKDSLPVPPPLYHGSGGFTTESRRVNQVSILEDAHRAGPFQCRKGIVQRATHFVIIGYQARRFARALEEMPQCLGSIGKHHDASRHGWYRHSVAKIPPGADGD